MASADGNDNPLRLLRHTSNSIIIITFYLILEELYTFFLSFSQMFFLNAVERPAAGRL
jgi:hypothetical protein